MDIPALLKIRLETIPAAVPYLEAPGTLDLPRHRDGNLSVGIVWRGNPRHRGDRHRSIAPERLFALGTAEGIQLYSL